MDPVELFDHFAIERFPLPKDAEIANLEQKLGTSFPDSYRRFLLRFNGAYFDDSKLSLHIAGIDDSLRLISGLNATVPTAAVGNSDDIDLLEDNSPIRLLPIGYTTLGNLVLLNLVQNGKVVLKVAYSGESFDVADDILEFIRLVRVAT